MKTICANLECLQDYYVKPEALGKLTRCKRCNTIFKIEEMPETVGNSNLFADEDESEAVEADIEYSSSTEVSFAKRRKTKEIIEEKIQHIAQAMKKIQPLLMNSYDRKDNESDTRRLVIDRILIDVLGYAEEDIRTEYKAYNNKVDYVLSVKGEECIVVEAKAVFKPLGKREIEQATSYGVLMGIKWVVLTNGLVWMLYRTADDMRSSHDLVFTIELLDGLDEEEASHFYLISKHGMCRKKLLEKRWQKISALSPENLTAAVLSEEVINRIRITLTAQTGYRATNEEIRHTLLSRNLMD
ncbi:MAG: type I restriction enzyme HsdR N-terminal domain-containing protein [Leptolyngbyaceae cyanobacterium bins.349]|nr:type I restriction enzyme HsdR N-terminal domain-containing protein [Leptolyngbyaceae cyanobacterium bins.349]